MLHFHNSFLVTKETVKTKIRDDYEGENYLLVRREEETNNRKCIFRKFDLLAV